MVRTVSISIDTKDTMLMNLFAEMPTSPHRLQCCVVPKTWLGPTFALRAKDNWRLHQLVDSGNASLLEMRNFLFARQFDLMQETNRTSEFSMRAIPFIQNVNQECKLFDVSGRYGDMEEILHTCREHFFLSVSTYDNLPKFSNK